MGGTTHLISDRDMAAKGMVKDARRTGFGIISPGAGVARRRKEMPLKETQAEIAKQKARNAEFLRQRKAAR